MQQHGNAPTASGGAVRTWFPDYDRARLVALADSHALDIAVAHGGKDVGPNEERLVVNLLRHHYTDYDQHEQTSARHRAACEAIAERYPWLAEECRAQIGRRERLGLEAADIAAGLEADREVERQERQALVAVSRAAAKKLTVGDAVAFEDGRAHGGRRTATVTAVGRSMVTVEYGLASGERRTRKLHASLVQPEGVL
ncbi:hypothetical protein [Kitasatospora sp. NPDC088134]|uniref:hypothetical protein n=1 Tax=Kitasatospora sp. NPDC088134 TaxID=3364071 RepID=UPI0038215354